METEFHIFNVRNWNVKNYKELNPPGETSSVFLTD